MVSVIFQNQFFTPCGGFVPLILVGKLEEETFDFANKEAVKFKKVALSKPVRAAAGARAESREICA